MTKLFPVDRTLTLISGVLCFIYYVPGVQDGGRGSEGREPAEACHQAHVFQSSNSRRIYRRHHPEGQVI